VFCATSDSAVEMKSEETVDEENTWHVLRLRVNMNIIMEAATAFFCCEY
jgi:hypothetical protein